MKEYEIFSGRLECPHKVLQLEYTPDGKQIVAIMKSVEQMKNGKKERPKYKTCNWDARTRNMISIKEYALPLSYIILNKGFMYIKPDTLKVQFLYLQPTELNT